MIINKIIASLVLLVLVSCSNDPFAASSSCDIGSAKGIQVVPYTGSQLADKQLSFMFVGGPTGVSLKISDFLLGRNIQAAFFMAGIQAETIPFIVSDIYSKGHLIGNMGYTGGNIEDSLDPRMSIRNTEWALLDYIRGSMFLLYMTDYRFSGLQAQYLNQNGLKKYVGPIKPDIGDVDDRGTNFLTDDQCWQQGKTEKQCAENYLLEIERVGKGLVIFHDTNEKTFNMLQILLDDLVGYTVVPLQDIPNIANDLSLSGADISAKTSSGTCNDYQ